MSANHWKINIIRLVCAMISLEVAGGSLAFAKPEIHFEQAPCTILLNKFEFQPPTLLAEAERLLTRIVPSRRDGPLQIRFHFSYGRWWLEFPETDLKSIRQIIDESIQNSSPWNAFLKSARMTYGQAEVVLVGYYRSGKLLSGSSSESFHVYVGKRDSRHPLATFGRTKNLNRLPIGAEPDLSQFDARAFAKASSAPELFLEIAGRATWNEADLVALFGIASREPELAFARLIQLNPGRFPGNLSSNKLLDLYFGYRARAMQDHGSVFSATFSGHVIPKESQKKYFVLTREYGASEERNARFLEALDLLALGSDLDASHLRRFFSTIAEAKPLVGYLNPKVQLGFYNPITVEQAKSALNKVGERLAPLKAENLSSLLEVYVPGRWMYPDIGISSLLANHKALLPILKQHTLLENPIPADLFKRMVDHQFLAVPSQRLAPLELSPARPWVDEAFEALTPSGFLREAKYRQLLAETGFSTQAHTLGTFTQRLRELSWQVPRQPTESPKLNETGRVDPRDVLVWFASIRDTGATPREFLDQTKSRAARIKTAVDAVEKEAPVIAREFERERLQEIFGAWIPVD